MNSSKQLLHLYCLAQRLYPAPFQAGYAKEQQQTVADLIEHADPSRRFSLWVRVWADLVPSILAEQINYQGNAIMNETPKYLKTVSLISALMLVPFVLVISMNALDRIVNHQNLYHSWLWQFPALGLWVVWLPQAALVLALISFLVYLSSGHGKNWFHRAMDIRHTWIIVLPGVLAFGIMFILAFHDSVHCLVVSPAELVNHASRVYQCAVNNNSLPGFRKFY